MNLRTAFFMTLVLAVAVSAGLAAVAPPELMHYQGFLRNVNGPPVADGNYAMVFRFYNAEVGGLLLLTDQHTGVQVVPTVDGVFTVQLGGGTIVPSLYATLGAMFSGASQVWMAMEVEGQILSGRVRVKSAGYALDAGQCVDANHAVAADQANQCTNADTLDAQHGTYYLNRANHSGVQLPASIYPQGSGSGLDCDKLDGTHSDGFLHTNNLEETKQGKLNVGASGAFNYGLTANGTTAGAYFTNPGGQQAWIAGDGSGPSFSSVAGYFENGDGKVWLASSPNIVPDPGDTGVSAEGNKAGGYFEDANSSGFAYVGYGDYGIQASGNTAGGRFERTNVSNASVWGGIGWLDGEGDYAGAYGQSTGSACLEGGSNHPQCVGVEGRGVTGGGYFKDTTSGRWCFVAYGSLNTYCGSGAMSTTQNHPEDRDLAVVTSAVEAHEVATYTRGTARLVNGTARVPLDETFKWIANPDIGLTAHLTPRGEAVALAVESLTTSELVVRGPVTGHADVVFDYLVYGLRIGFEESAGLAPRMLDASVPELTSSEAVEDGHAEADLSSALERYKAMRAGLGVTDPLDLTRSRQLVAAINRYRPEPGSATSPETDEPRRASRADGLRSHGTAAVGPGTSQGAAAANGTHEMVPRELPTDGDGNVYARSFRPSSSALATLTLVSEPVQAGDVLVISHEQPGTMSLSRVAGDTAVVGIVAAEPGVVLGADRPTAEKDAAEPVSTDQNAATATPAGQVANSRFRTPVTTSGVVPCKVDASFGAIRPGDLLTTSTTPGHAMRADDPRPGTILGKALESLDTGTGLIRVLVMLR